MKNVFLLILTILLTLKTMESRRRKNRRLQIVPNAPAKKLNQKPAKRKLLLNWFDDSEEHLNTKDHQDNVKKLMDLLKLAHSFKGDPNFDVNVEINYKNDNTSVNKHEERRLNLLKKSAKKYGQVLRV